VWSLQWGQIAGSGTCGVTNATDLEGFQTTMSCSGNVVTINHLGPAPASVQAADPETFTYAASGYPGWLSSHTIDVAGAPHVDTYSYQTATYGTNRVATAWPATIGTTDPGDPSTSTTIVLNAAPFPPSVLSRARTVYYQSPLTFTDYAVPSPWGGTVPVPASFEFSSLQTGAVPVAWFETVGSTVVSLSGVTLNTSWPYLPLQDLTGTTSAVNPATPSTAITALSSSPVDGTSVTCDAGTCVATETIGGVVVETDTETGTVESLPTLPSPFVGGTMFGARVASILAGNQVAYDSYGRVTNDDDEGDDDQAAFGSLGDLPGSGNEDDGTGFTCTAAQANTVCSAGTEGTGTFQQTVSQNTLPNTSVTNVVGGESLGHTVITTSTSISDTSSAPETGALTSTGTPAYSSR
jgi:hypothetical protein